MSVPTEIISAIIGAASGGGVVWVAHRQDVRRSRIQEVRNTLLQLLDLRQATMGSRLSPAESNLWMQRRAMLLAVAASQADAAGRSLSTHDWLALAEECGKDHNFRDAFTYYERAVRRARREDILAQVIALRSFAAYRYNAGPQRDVVKGALLYRTAVELTAPGSDAYMQYLTGYTFTAWARSSFFAQQDDWRGLIDEAKRLYAAAAPGYPPAHKSLEAVQAAKHEWDHQQATSESLATDQMD